MPHTKQQPQLATTTKETTMCKHPALLFDPPTMSANGLRSASLVGRMLLESSVVNGGAAVAPLSLADNHLLTTQQQQDTYCPQHGSEADALTVDMGSEMVWEIQELADKSPELLVLRTSVEPIHPIREDPDEEQKMSEASSLKRHFSMTAFFATDEGDDQNSVYQPNPECWAPTSLHDIDNNNIKRQKVTPSPAPLPDAAVSTQPSHVQQFQPVLCRPHNGAEDDSQEMGSSEAVQDDCSRYASIPVTFMPPTVLTSVMDLPDSQPWVRRRPFRKNTNGPHPQDVLDQILFLRGLVPVGATAKDFRISAKDSAYDITPTPLQLASYGTELIQCIHVSNVAKLHGLFRAGLSRNACNQFRDSIVDLVCKRSNEAVFSVLIQYGCELKVCDGFGRTPLHHCCWSTDFSPEIAGYILTADPQQLFMEDHHGRTPLEYVRSGRELDWIEFLQRKCNVLFPPGMAIPPARKQTRKKLPNPHNALPIRLAEAVSSGHMSPQEAQCIHLEDIQYVL